jgi:hypothetical protein
VGFDLQRGGQQQRARQQHLLLAGAHVAAGASSRHSSGASADLPICHTTALGDVAGGLHFSRGALLTVQAHKQQQQQQQVSQRLMAFNSQSSNSIVDLQRRLPADMLRQSRSLGAHQMGSSSSSSSSSSSRVQSGWWGAEAELIRCRCGGAGSRGVCGLHAALRRAGGGPRLRAAAGAIVAAVAAEGSVRHRQHPRMRIV